MFPHYYSLLLLFLFPFLTFSHQQLTFFYKENNNNAPIASPCFSPSQPCSSLTQIRDYLENNLTMKVGEGNSSYYWDVNIYLMSNLTKPTRVCTLGVSMNLTVSTYFIRNMNDADENAMNEEENYYFIKQDERGINNVEDLTIGCNHFSMSKVRLFKLKIDARFKIPLWTMDSCLLEGIELVYYTDLLIIQKSVLIQCSIRSILYPILIRNSTLMNCDLSLGKFRFENTLILNSNIGGKTNVYSYDVLDFGMINTILKQCVITITSSQQIIFSSTQFESSTLIITSVRAVIMQNCKIDHTISSWIGIENIISNTVSLNNSTIQVIGSIDATFKNMNFTDSETPLSIERAGTLSIEGCIFERNRNALSISNDAKFTRASSISLKTSTFRDNWSKQGGALYLNNVRISISNCEFIENKAANGGAIFADPAFITDSDSKFISNQAIGNFEGCSGAIDCGNGGAIYSPSGFSVFFRSSFEYNLAVKGGAYFGEIRIFKISNIGNLATYSGNFAYFSQSDRFNISKTIPPSECGSENVKRVLWKVSNSNTLNSSDGKSITTLFLYPGQQVSFEIIQIIDEFDNALSSTQLLPLVSVQNSKSSIITIQDKESNNTNIVNLIYEWFEGESNVNIQIVLPEFSYSFGVRISVQECPFDYGYDGLPSNRVCKFKNYSAIIVSTIFGVILMIILLGFGALFVTQIGRRLFRLYKKDKRESQIAKKIIDKKFIFGEGATPLLSNIQTKYSDNLLIPIEDIEIVKRIGEGSHGSVYLAKWNGINVAVKSLKTDDELLEDEFEHEASLLNSLRHPSIVRLFGVSVSSNTRYMVVEFMEHGSLEEAIFNSKSGRMKLSLKKKIEILMGISKGMDYLHSLKPLSLLHRDLKCGNVLLDANFEPKICDFGLSKLTSNSGSFSMTMNLGTILYMAPELIGSGEEIGNALDVYSFSIILYELFFEEKPFFSNSSKIHKFSRSTNQDTFALSVPVMVVNGERPKIPWSNRNELEEWTTEFIEPFEKKLSIDLFTMCNICNDYIELMKQCWNTIPRNRPTFKEIIRKLEKIYSNLNH